MEKVLVETGDEANDATRKEKKRKIILKSGFVNL